MYRPFMRSGLVDRINNALNSITYNFLDTYRSQKSAIREVNIMKKRYVDELKLEAII